jgi:hypothetical protein
MLGVYPEHRNTGNAGYLGNFVSLAESSHK